LVALPSQGAEPAVTLWKASLPMPKSAEIPVLKGVSFSVVKLRDPARDEYNWLHGIGLAWHQDALFASFGLNRGVENTAGEEAHAVRSEDAGQTWSPLRLIDRGEEQDLAISHGVFLSHGSALWAFHGSFTGRLQHVHTRAYSMDPSSRWTPHGVVARDGFWPMQELQPMPDGNWIMAGLKVGGRIGGSKNPAAVAVSRGSDFREWDVIAIPKPATLNMWGESTVIVEAESITCISRYQRPIALVSISHDLGRT
jgi:hypothetical protein